MPNLNRRYAASTICLAVVLSGCAVPDRAGGNVGVEATEVRFAVTGNPGPQITAWVNEVDQLSKGTLKITYVSDAHADQPDFESRTVNDVRAGMVDFALVGARVFDRVGLTSFQPLLAPMLIDSLELEGKVFEAGVPQQLLPTLEQIGVVGVGILPGPIRKVLGVRKPFTQPADFAGQIVGIQASGVAEKTFRTLGSTSREVRAGTPLTGLDAYDQQLSSILGNHYNQAAQFVTGNLNLWPRPLVIIANPAFYTKLTDDQRTIMQAAAKNATAVAMETERSGDADAISALCKAGLTFSQANDNDLEALRTALQPVYNAIGEQPGNAATLEKIGAIAEALQRSPDSAQCSSPQSTGQPTVSTGQPTVSPLDGTYRMRVVWPDVHTSDARCVGGFEAGPGGAIYDMEFHQGTMQLWIRVGGPDAARELGDQVGYRFFQDQLQFLNSDGSTTTWDYTYADGKLTLDNPRNPTNGVDCGTRAIFTTKPWIRQ